MRFKVATVIAVVLTCLVACGKSNSEAGTTTTTEVDRTAEALASAVEACNLADTNKPSQIDDWRTVLDRQGVSTSGSDDVAVTRAWAKLVDMLGGDRADELATQVAYERTRSAADKAALAAALDATWDPLHGGLMHYAEVLDPSRFRQPENSEVMSWFDDIGRACEKARALNGEQVVAK